MDNLDFLFTSHDSTCAIANSSCYTWLNETGKVEKVTYHFKEKATWLTKADLYDLWDCSLSLGWIIWVLGSEAS